MPNNLPFFLKPLTHQIERVKHSRMGAWTLIMVNKLRVVEDYVPLRRRKDRSTARLSAAEVAQIYETLPPEEQDMISELVTVAASEAPTVVNAIAPRGENQTNKAIGRLVLCDRGPDDRFKPLHNMLVELWDRNFGDDDILGRGETDKDGRFVIRYDPADAGMFDDPDLELRVFETHHTYKRGVLQLTQNLVFTVSGSNDVTEQTYDFGEQRIPYWQYKPHSPTPRVLIMDNGTPPQSFAPGRSLKMAEELGELQLTKLAHLDDFRRNAGQPSLETIQADYPTNKTLQLGPDSRSDEYFGERMLNGMTATIFDRDPTQPNDANRYWVHHHWNSYEHDDEHAAPDVDIWFEKRNERVLPTKIRLQFHRRDEQGNKLNAEESPRTLVFTPADKDRWEQAKRIARVSASLHAELDVHLAQTHLNTEQYAIAAYRNFRKSPLRYMLLPHLKEVVLINQEADRWLLGEQGFITRSQALTANAVDARLAQVVGTLDWKNWKPRRIICENHRFAQAAHLFWQMLDKYVDRFFEKHDEEIRQHWYEVQRFSNDLVEHSVPMFLCKYLRDGLLKKDGTPRPAKDVEWYEPNERMDMTIPRVDGKAIQPVTTSADACNESIENMKQVCRYVIFHATFFHHWPNSQQLDDGGEIAYSGLGLRFGKTGVMTSEDDCSVAPPPDRASEQLWFANALTKISYGFIMSNEEHDIDPMLIDELRSRQKEFAKRDVDISRIPSRPNI